MNIFKSIWLRMRKSNGLPGNGNVLIPMDKQEVPQEVIKEKKPRKPRAKKTTVAKGEIK